MVSRTAPLSGIPDILRRPRPFNTRRELTTAYPSFMEMLPYVSRVTINTKLSSSRKLATQCSEQVMLVFIEVTVTCRLLPIL